MRLDAPKRADVIDRLAEKHKTTRKHAGEMFDSVLTELTPWMSSHLESEWVGGTILGQFRRWLSDTRP
jgi:nucleoid DNA-binding protein